MNLTIDQLADILEHNRDNSRDTDIWLLLNEDGDTAIVPDQPTAEFQNPNTWPKYICRSGAVTAHVSYDTAQAADPNRPELAAVDGLYSALDHLNWAVAKTTASSRTSRATAALVRALTNRGDH